MTKREIKQNIAYWQRRLDTLEAFSLLESCIRKERNGILAESEQEEIDYIKKLVVKNVKDEKDVKKFVDAHDERVKKSNVKPLQKAWAFIKKALSYGAKGIAWLFKNWKLVLIVIAAVCIMKFGFWNLLGKGITKALSTVTSAATTAAVKTADVAVNKAADAFAAVTGPEYMKAGEKISQACAAAGGYGGWSMAGLGGGLR